MDYQGIDESSVYRIAGGSLRRCVIVVKTIVIDIPGLDYYDYQDNWMAFAKGVREAAYGSPGYPIIVTSCKVGNRGLPGPAARDAAVGGNNLPDSMATGEVRNVSMTFHNIGLLPWNTGDGFGLGAVGESDPFVSGSNRISLPADKTVLPGESVTFSTRFTAPSTQGVYVSDWRMVQDGAEWFGQTLAKNISVTGRPDLTVTNGSYSPTQPLQGDLATVSFSVQNVGSGAASSNWVQVYLSRDTIKSPDDFTWLYDISVPPLNPGQQYDRTISKAIPFIAPGPYHILVECDVINDVIEVSETNNIRDIGVLSIQPGPDLAVTYGLVRPDVGNPKRPVRVSFRIENIGKATSAGNWVQVYLSTNATLDANDLIWIQGIWLQPLSPGEAFTYDETTDVPNLAYRTYYVLVQCDVRNEVKENDEGNNVSTISTLRLAARVDRWFLYR